MAMQRETTEPTPPAPSGIPGAGVCSTVVDELLEAQLEREGGVCSTVVDELLEAQLERER